MTDSEDLWRPRNPQQGDGQQYQQEQQAWQPQEYDPNAHQQRLQPPQDQQWWREEERRQTHRLPPSYPLPPQYGEQPGWDQPPQQPYPQQQPYPGQPQYTPGPPQYTPGPPPRQGRPRKGHTVRNILAGVGGLVVVIIGINVAANGGHSVKTSGTTGTTGTPGTSGQTAAAAQAPATARVGSAITLSGNDSGEKMAVTVTKIISSASPGDEFTSPPAGDRLYAVQFRLDDTGSAAYSDAPSNGAAAVDSSGQSYESSITDTATGCTSFPGTENIAPGASGLGCIVFEVPEAAKIIGVQFTLDSGMGPQTGQWDVG
jgi:Domain of unknown function (DUF4352)